MSSTCPRMLLAMLALAAAGTACVPNPATGVAATNGPLRVQYSSGTDTYVSNDKTGEDVTTSSSGAQTVTEHFSAVEHNYHWTDWRYSQGYSELDEQDYYRIAGDDEAVREIAGIRSRAALKMKIGAPIMVAGIVAGLALSAIGQSSNNASLAQTGYLAGSLVAGAGGFVWYWGRSEMENRHHLKAERAEALADLIGDCNEGHCTRQLGGRQNIAARRAAEEAAAAAAT